MSDGSLNRAYLVLGSNIDAERNLPAAAKQLTTFGTIIATSQVWETEPIGFADQSNFLNAAVLLETNLSATQLRNEAIAGIEASVKRERDPNNINGPRTIDIDIALFNHDVIDELRIPDPDILTRDFAAQVLAELEPDYVHPIKNCTLREICESLRRSSPGMRPRSDVDLLR